MMKKKNVAMAMAAVTAASAVAPVVADAATQKYELDSSNSAELIRGIKPLLRDTYIVNGVAQDQSVYEVIITAGTGAGTTRATANTIKDVTKIEAALDLAKANSSEATVEIYKKGKRELANGDIVATEIKTYKDANELMEEALRLQGLDATLDTSKMYISKSAADTKYNANTGKLEVLVGVETTATGSTAQEVQDLVDLLDELEVKSGINVSASSIAVDTQTTSKATITVSKKIELNVGDQRADIESTTGATVLLKDGKEKVLETITSTSSTTTDKTIEVVEDLKKKLDDIASFKIVDAVEPDKELIATIKVGQVGERKTVTAESLVNNGTLTEDGKELLDTINSTYEKASGGTTTTYTVTAATAGIKPVTTTAGTTYQTELTLQGNAPASATGWKNEELAKITITSSERAELVKLIDVLDDVIANRTPQVIDELSGDTRFETAIEISNKTVTNPTVDVRNSIVLVGSNAVVDGLAAGPLAAQLNTSILLTEKDSVKASIMDEIERVLNIENTSVSKLKDKTAYLVGGVEVIGEGVVEQLSKLGVKVERVAGGDRYETSMEIAELMAKKATSPSKKAYIVGGNGLADAMSISAYASAQKSPIIVVNKDGLSEEVLETITEDYNKVDIIGGDAVVSADVEAQLADELTKSNVVRVKGDGREGTNAAVINKYYTSSTTNKVYVANNGFVKDIAAKGDDQMIDAMTVAPLAGQMNAPIVLVGNELTEEQSDAIELRTNSNASVTKVGGVVVNTVVETVGKLIGFVK